MADVSLIVDLFDDINFGGSFRTLVRPLADFRQIEFNDRVSSVIVTAGPNFLFGDGARLWSDVNFQGVPLAFGPGQFPDLRVFNFNDVASSMDFIGPSPTPTPTISPVIVAQDSEIVTIPLQLSIITPAGTSLVSVQQNNILNLTATGTFTSTTGVLVNGSFIDQIVVLIRDNTTGATRLATGQTTVPFSKNIIFPQLAGIPTSSLRIVVTASNPTSSFTLSGNILSKTVQFSLITQVVRVTATALKLEAGKSGDPVTEKTFYAEVFVE